MNSIISNLSDPEFGSHSHLDSTTSVSLPFHTGYHIWSTIPADTRRWHNVELILPRRPRRRANINSTLYQRLVFAGMLPTQCYLKRVSEWKLLIYTFYRPRRHRLNDQVASAVTSLYNKVIYNHLHPRLARWHKVVPCHPALPCCCPALPCGQTRTNGL